MKRLFISQPMRDRTDEEIQAERDRILEEVREKYPDVEPIHSFFQGASNMSPIECLAEALKRMEGADIIYFAPGWNTARGCVVEHYVAELYLTTAIKIERF
jgi:hypothetical protein